jgi:hypothetical protein
VVPGAVGEQIKVLSRNTNQLAIDSYVQFIVHRRQAQTYEQQSHGGLSFLLQ